MIFLEHETLGSTMFKTLKRLGSSDEQAGAVVESLIETSLRGVDSHGINLFPHYCRGLQQGRITAKPAIRVERRSLSALTVHGDYGFGHYIGKVAMDSAIEAAKVSGIAIASVCESSHFGAASFFGLRAARNGCIGFSFCNADSLVKQPASVERLLGTNPICFTAPVKNEEPLCLDMATSTISWNKVKNALRMDTEIPDGFAYTKEGTKTKNPKNAYSLEATGDYKGFGLGFMIDILCGLLSGEGLSTEISPMYDSDLSKPRKMGQCFIAIDVSKLTSLDVFSERLAEYCKLVRNLPIINEGSEPMVPGDPELKEASIRRVKGIPIYADMWQEFIDIEESFKNCSI